MPSTVNLTPIMVDAPTHRDNIRRKTLDAFRQAFPLKTKNFTVELSDPHIEPLNFSSKEQKQAILEGRTLSERVRANLAVRDAQGAIVDQAKNFTLMHLPWFTPRHTFILDGNEYSVSNQIRTKPGVYTRRRGNEDLEASFNLSKGANFRLSMDPADARLHMEYGTTRIPLYPILRSLGVPHQDVATHWGPEVAAMNRDAFKSPDRHIEKLYDRLIHPSLQTHKSLEEKITAVHDYFRNTKMDPEVNKATLGTAYDSASPRALLDASKKLLDVHRAGTDTDDRDSLEYKTFHSVDDFIKERIALDARMMKNKVGIKLDASKGDLRKALTSAPFTRSINTFLTNSSLSALPTQINPMELIDHAVRVTSLGEGGISSERAIPLEARNQHASQFAIMDGVRTPESFKAGIDIRAAIGARRDDAGTLYARMRNLKSGLIEYLKPADMMRATVAFPGESVKPGKLVDAMVRGEVQRTSASNVTHQVDHIADLYGPTTNLLPLLNGMQGNRSLMASKHQSQALSLVHREAPLVQVRSWEPGKTVEQIMAGLIVPTAPVAGRISKVDGDWIHLAPDASKIGMSKVAVVLAHVGGASGSGKTTLLQQMSQKYPGLVTKDMDDFDDEASNTLFPGARKNDYSDAMVQQLAQRRQTLLDSFLQQQGHLPVLLGGHHTEGDTTLNIPTENRILLDVGPLRSAWRGYRRSQNEQSDHRRRLSELPADYREAKDTIHQLKGLGYTPMGVDDIHTLIDDSMRKTAAEDEEIYNDFLKLGEADLQLHYDTHFPLAAKTFLHNNLTVKPGDYVEKGQHLADSNFTRGGVLALGTNLRVAYMPYRGLNTNDGIVVSEGAAQKLVSEHMYKHVLPLDPNVQLGREKHRAYYGNQYSAAQYNQLDDSGVIKPGTKVLPGDPLIAALRENQLTGNAVILGKLSKSLVKPYRDEVVKWDHAMPGEVIDAVQAGGRVTVTVKTTEPLNIGDKLTGRYGNKGVIAKIVPDHQMIHDEQRRPVDLLFTSAGIVSRINPAQLVESALGKVADHTGKSIAVEQFAAHDNVEHAQGLLKKYGLKDKETVYDPITKKEIPNVFVGKSYILKLFKTTDSNWSAHGAEKYDLNQQPARGGDDGAKAIGKMEFDGLVAHNARNVLREASSIKSQKNDEFWRAIQLGLPTPAPKTTFAYDKFLNMLQGAGVKVSKAGSRLTLGPLTDSDITKMSAGALKDPHKLLRSKDLAPEVGGLFDPATTGGESGTKWSHVDLHEKVVNPVFEEPVRRLLGLTQKEFRDRHGDEGGDYFHRALSKIDVAAKTDDLLAQTKKLKGTKLDDAVKQLKYLSALTAQKLTPQDAYVLSKIPVTPPVLRPILPLKDGRLQVSDANLLYRDAFLASQKLSEVKGVLPANMLREPRNHLYDAVSAVFGVGDPVSPTAEKRGAKGYLAFITGSRPGNGFFQGKLMKRQQDVSGRGTIAPDPSLSMDEIGIPEDMLWGMYGKFVIGRLVKRGYTATHAQQMVEGKDPVAKQELLNESRERPVIVNRAPSLHRFNVVGAYPKMVSGKTIMLNPFAERGMNADYDGDAVQLHAPVTPGGVADVKKMTLSNLIFSDRRPGSLNIAPDMEAVLGLHRASQASTGKAKKYKNKEDALAAYHKGELQLSDTVEIGT